ncbi:MAG TPA: DUF2336 domain-containing protein [Candidatus Cybelea sp.]|nr:DUF2336 domain-containing protein [Candidatus Cybelea sp.]
MPQYPLNQPDDLMALARNRAADSRRQLLENMTDMFLATDTRLSERERTLMEDILVKLVHEMEMEVRRDLAIRLARADAAPHELIVLLANDQIEIARPLLDQSRLLRDADLVEIVKLRSQEHRLAVAARQGIGEAVTQALIDYGDDQTIEALIANPDAILSRHAVEYLVEESRRIDRFQEPLLARSDLPVDLAHRMFWWVSASLRQVILTRFRIEEALLDELLEEAAVAAATVSPPVTEAERLAMSLAERDGISERFVLQNLRAGHVLAAVAGLARLAGLDLAATRRIVFDPGGEALAACAKSIGISRSGFAAIYLLTREAHDRSQVIEPGRVETMMKLFDKIEVKQARAMLRLWTRDPAYNAAIDAIASAPSVRRIAMEGG